MKSIDKQKLKRQIEDVSKQLMNLDGAVLTTFLLATCNALLKMAEQILSEIDSTEIRDDIFANYIRFAHRVSKFYEFSKKNSYNKINDHLQSIVEEIQKNQEEEVRLKYEYESVISTNKELKKQIDNLEKELNEKISEKKFLDNMYKKNSPEIIQKQKNKNDELFNIVIKQREEFEKLKEQCDKYEDERESLKRDISDINKSIADIPEENVILRDKYKDLERLLFELQNANIEYSPEKQKELKEMVDKLTPIVAENELATDELSKRLESLKKQKTQYDEEKNILTTNLIELISSSMNDLKKYLKEHEEFLDKTEKTANLLEENLNKCKARREEYSNWYETSKTPLDAMIENLKYNEYENLKNTLDLAQITDVKEKFNNIERDLKYMDSILEKCYKATQKDLENIKDRARG